MIGFVYLLFFGLFSQEPVYESLSSDIIKKYNNEILKPNDLSIYVTGGSSDKGIKSITLGVNRKGPGTIREGRYLIVKLVKELMIRYNNCDQIRPYLLYYPFNEDNFVFKISYVNSKGGFWLKQEESNDNEQIALIGLYYGTIYYYVYTGAKIGPLSEVHKESFSNALNILENESVNW